MDSVLHRCGFVIWLDNKMSTRQIRVYTASKTNHAAMWLRLRAEWPEVHFTARWPLQVLAGLPETPNFAMQFWQDDLEDVKFADVVLVFAEKYMEPGIMYVDDNGQPLKEAGEWEHLRGALVEAGMGIALGKRILVIGDAPDYGSWQHHPLCDKVDNFEKARTELSHIQQYEIED